MITWESLWIGGANDADQLTLLTGVCFPPFAIILKTVVGAWIQGSDVTRAFLGIMLSPILFYLGLSKWCHRSWLLVLAKAPQPHQISTRVIGHQMVRSF